MTTAVEYNPYDPEIQHNPYPCWKRLRDEVPAYYNPEFKFWAITRYDDVLRAMLDPVGLISSKGNTIDGADAGQGFLIGMDPPDHTVYRKLLSRVFTPRRVSELEPAIRTKAARYLDDVRDAGRFDMVDDFSLRLPLDTISELLGIPDAMHHDLHQWCVTSLVRDAEATADGRPPAAALEAMMNIRMAMLELVVERRKNPGDDIISMLINAEVTDDDGVVRRMDDAFIAAQFHLLAFAGHETVAKLIGNGSVALWWYPDQRRELVADPSLMSGAVEEMLRWDNPAPLEGRWSARDLEYGGVTIPADQRVMLVMGSANHDERQYDEPELFDIHRVIERPLNFGFGIHLCLGAALARLETRIAFEEILARFPEYEIDEPNVVRGPATMFRGLQHLPVVTV